MPFRGKIKKAEPGPPPGVSLSEWDKHLNRGSGRLKKADFPMGAGPEDWDAVGTSGQIAQENGASKAKSDEKEKDGDLFGGDGTQLMPHLRRIHKMGHVKRASPGDDIADMVEAQAASDMSGLPMPLQGLSPAIAKLLFVDRNKRRLEEMQQTLLEDALMRALLKQGHVVPREKLAQGEFEYADVGPTAGERGPRVTWQIPKLKRAAGLDQEKGLDEPEEGTDPPAAFPQPKGRLEALTRSQGPLKKVSEVSYRAFLDEIWKMGSGR